MGGFANVDMVFDGKTLTLLGKNSNLYSEVEAPGTIAITWSMYCATNTTDRFQERIC
jgi:hypothetical protein